MQKSIPFRGLTATPKRRCTSTPPFQECKDRQAYTLYGGPQFGLTAGFTETDA